MGNSRKGVISMNREAFRLAFQVPAAGSGELTERVRGDCTLERLSVRIYIGAQLDLKLTPMIQRAAAGGIREPLIKYAPGGKQYIDGDDDTFVWSVSVPMQVDDEIVIGYVNDDVANAYDFACDFEVDYLAGTMRLPAAGRA